jgi:iron(III) transport system ATP-binding protein
MPTTTEPQAFLEIRDLVKIFGADRAVDGICFRVERGEFLTLLGPSGCGKTTTLMCIAGLHQPDGGEIRLDRDCLTSVPQHIYRPPEQRGIGMVFQSYAIWPHMTVAQNVSYPLEVRRVPRDERQARVADALRRVQLLDYAERPAPHLSGGQQQRVALARAIVFNPRLLLFDEPLSNLDAKLREEMRVELKRLQQTLGITSIYVTHDQAEALVLSDRIITMSKGRIEQEGDPRSMYAHPVNRFVSEFIGVANFLSGTVVATTPGRAVVDVTNGELSCTLNCTVADGISPGDRITVSIRPEHVRLVSDSNAATGHNCIEGEVVAAVFLGNYIDCRVQWGAVEWKVQANRRQAIRQGRRVWLAISPEHCLCLRD